MGSRREVLLSDLMKEIPMDIDSSVLSDDRVLIRNVIACLCTLRLQRMFHTVTIERVKNGYHVVAKVVDGDDFDFNTVDLEVLSSVSPLRVTNTSIERRRGGLQLRVRVLASDQPVNITETSISHIRKRQRFALQP
jgi:ribosomal protein L30/L7E